MGFYVLFYHYTSERGLRQIKSSGFIKESSHDNNHAHFGEGTYGTSLPPSVGKQKVAQNNWKDKGKFYIQNGKVDWAVEVRIPRHKVREAPRRNRDILVHDGPIYLRDYQWKALKVPDFSDDQFHDDYDDDDYVSARYSRGGQRLATYASGRYSTSNPRTAVAREARSSPTYTPGWTNDDYDYGYNFTESRRESWPSKPRVPEPEGGWVEQLITAAVVIAFALYYFFCKH